MSLPWVDITTILKQEEPGGSRLLTLTRFPPSAGRLEVALADARLHNTISLRNVLLPEMVALAPNKHLKLSLIMAHKDYGSASIGIGGLSEWS